MSCSPALGGRQGEGPARAGGVPWSAELALPPCPLAAPSAPGSIRFSELTTISVNVSWEPPPLPNGILEGYRLVYEPCTPVDGEGMAGGSGDGLGGPGSASVPAGVSKIVTVDVKGNSPLWMKVKDLAEGVTYRFRIRAKTFAYGPDVKANITTGPGEGMGDTWGTCGVREETGWGLARPCASLYPLSPVLPWSPGAPGPPGEPFISRYGSAITIHWSSGDPGQGPITRYVIEARPSGTAAASALHPHLGGQERGKLRQGVLGWVGG